MQIVSSVRCTSVIALCTYQSMNKGTGYRCQKRNCDNEATETIDLTTDKGETLRTFLSCKDHLDGLLVMLGKAADERDCVLSIPRGLQMKRSS